VGFNRMTRYRVVSSSVKRLYAVDRGMSRSEHFGVDRRAYDEGTLRLGQGDSDPAEVLEG